MKETLRNKRFIYGIIFILCLALIPACENSIEEVKSITETKTLPTLSANNVETLYSDSAILKVKMLTPLLNRYPFAEKPYYEFPKGIQVFLFDKNMHPSSQVSAKYAIYYEREKLWEGRNDVVAINEKGEKLNTEQLFWDQQKGIIYSRKFSRITNQDGVFYGKEGFEADQNFTKWKLIGTKGTVNVKE
jgi:LPS export ABC transporter protein LptC